MQSAFGVYRQVNFKICKCYMKLSFCYDNYKYGENLQDYVQQFSGIRNVANVNYMKLYIREFFLELDV